MRTRYFAIILSVIVLFSLNLHGCSREKWEEYSFDEGDFSIMFPGKPEVTTETQVPGLDVELKNTLYSVNIGHKSTYSVIIGDLSGPGTKTLEWDHEVMAEIGKQGITNQGGEIVSEKIITMAGQECWEFEVTADTTDSTIRMFRVGLRIYTLEVAREKGADFSEKTGKFFGSFALK